MCHSLEHTTCSAGDPDCLLRSWAVAAPWPLAHPFRRGKPRVRRRHSPPSLSSSLLPSLAQRAPWRRSAPIRRIAARGVGGPIRGCDGPASAMPVLGSVRLRQAFRSRGSHPAPAPTFGQRFTRSPLARSTGRYGAACSILRDGGPLAVGPSLRSLTVVPVNSAGFRILSMAHFPIRIFLRPPRKPAPLATRVSPTAWHITSVGHATIGSPSRFWGAARPPFPQQPRAPKSGRTCNGTLKHTRPSRARFAAPERCRRAGRTLDTLAVPR